MLLNVGRRCLQRTLAAADTNSRLRLVMADSSTTSRLDRTGTAFSTTSTSCSSTNNPFDYSLQFDVSDYQVQYGEPREVWVENLDTVEAKRLGLTHLHPDVFSVYPRMDIIHANMVWQSKYNKVNYNHVKNVREMIETFGGGKKPWPQKGTGRARQGSIRAPQWINGGKAHGARGPKPLYYMLDYHQRVYGLTMTLSVKFVQDDLHVVKDLNIPTDQPEYLTDLIQQRGWGKTTLFVDTSDEMPRNITAATDSIPHVNLMPAYGLNVLSMTKHETLVLTESAVNHLTRKLLFALTRTDLRDQRIKNREGPKQISLKMENNRPLV